MFDSLNAELSELTDRRELRERQTDKYSIYETYMNQVLAMFDEFHEIGSVTARYETLVSTKLVYLYYYYYFI